jgi:hypothetical protein
MQEPDLTAEIAALEEQLSHYKNLLEKAFEDDLNFGEAKVILQNMKKIADKIADVKSRGTNNSH